MTHIIHTNPMGFLNMTWTLAIALLILPSRAFCKNPKSAPPIETTFLGVSNSGVAAVGAGRSDIAVPDSRAMDIATRLGQHGFGQLGPARIDAALHFPLSGAAPELNVGSQDAAVMGQPQDASPLDPHFASRRTDSKYLLRDSIGPRFSGIHKSGTSLTAAPSAKIKSPARLRSVLVGLRAWAGRLLGKNSSHSVNQRKAVLDETWDVTEEKSDGAQNPIPRPVGGFQFRRSTLAPALSRSPISTEAESTGIHVPQPDQAASQSPHRTGYLRLTLIFILTLAAGALSAGQTLASQVLGAVSAATAQAAPAAASPLFGGIWNWLSSPPVPFSLVALAIGGALLGLGIKRILNSGWRQQSVAAPSRGDLWIVLGFGALILGVGILGPLGIPFAKAFLSTASIANWLMTGFSFWAIQAATPKIIAAWQAGTWRKWAWPLTSLPALGMLGYALLGDLPSMSLTAAIGLISSVIGLKRQIPSAFQAATKTETIKTLLAPSLGLIMFLLIFGNRTGSNETAVFTPRLLGESRVIAPDKWTFSLPSSLRFVPFSIPGGEFHRYDLNVHATEDIISVDVSDLNLTLEDFEGDKPLVLRRFTTNLRFTWKVDPEWLLDAHNNAAAAEIKAPEGTSSALIGPETSPDVNPIKTQIPNPKNRRLYEIMIWQVQLRLHNALREAVKDRRHLTYPEIIRTAREWPAALERPDTQGHTLTHDLLSKYSTAIEEIDLYKSGWETGKPK